jgi:hypothetical protein
LDEDKLQYGDIMGRRLISTLICFEFIHWTKLISISKSLYSTSKSRYSTLKNCYVLILNAVLLVLFRRRLWRICEFLSVPTTPGYSKSWTSIDHTHLL